MLTVSDKQVFGRWNSLTPTIREELFSEVNADFVWKLCQSNHLPEDKSHLVAEMAGYVLMGFLHPEDLAGELVTALSVDNRLAKSIADSINTRIFVPIRQEIDHVYSPLSKFETGPKMIRDIGAGQVATIVAAAKPPVAPMTPAPKPISAIPKPPESKFAPFIAPKSSLPTSGWSKLTTTEPPRFGPGDADRPEANDTGTGSFRRASTGHPA